MEEQGYPFKRNILYQDNKSAILSEINGQTSAGKRSRALDIRYFFMTDQVEKGNVEIQYCPTDEMFGDFMQGEKFKKFQDCLQSKGNRTRKSHLSQLDSAVKRQECVGDITYYMAKI